MKKLLIAILFVAVIASLYLTYPAHNANTSKPASGPPNVLNVSGVVAGNNRFSVNLYNELSQGSGNFVFSPYSIYSAMAMVYEGARGETAKELRAVFEFPKPLAPSFSAVYSDITKNESVKIGNGIWIQEGFPILRSYKEIIEKYYKGKVTSLNFAKEPEKSREIINNYIANETGGKIKNLIPPGGVGPGTVFVVTNAIYFNGTWKWKFNKTMKMDFRTPNGTVKVQMMYMRPRGELRYANLKDVEVLELPYTEKNMSMIVILPKKDLKSIEPLSLQKIDRWMSKLKPTRLDAVYLPKFEINSKYVLNDLLKALGVKTAFTKNADFSGISSKRIWISSVIHQAYINVTKTGTVASAATSVIFVSTSLPIHVFKADHPFIFLIQKDGVILFMGRVTNPSRLSQ